MRPIKAWAILPAPWYFTKVPRVFRTRATAKALMHGECLCCIKIVRVEIREVLKKRKVKP